MTNKQKNRKSCLQQYYVTAKASPPQLTNFTTRQKKCTKIESNYMQKHDSIAIIMNK